MREGRPGAKMTSKHHWEANVRVSEIKITGEDGNTVTFKDSTSFSADGKVQTLERDGVAPVDLRTCVAT